MNTNTNTNTSLERWDGWLPHSVEKELNELDTIRWRAWLHHKQVFGTGANSRALYDPDAWGPLMTLEVGERALWWERQGNGLYSFIGEDDRHPGGGARIGEVYIGKDGNTHHRDGVAFPTERVTEAIKGGWLRYVKQTARASIEARMIAERQAAAAALAARQAEADQRAWQQRQAEKAAAAARGERLPEVVTTPNRQSVSAYGVFPERYYRAFDEPLRKQTAEVRF